MASGHPPYQPEQMLSLARVFAKAALDELVTEAIEQQDKGTKRRAHYEAGTRFGKYTVIGRRGLVWIIVCDCGLKRETAQLSYIVKRAEKGKEPRCAACALKFEAKKAAESRRLFFEACRKFAP